MNAFTDYAVDDDIVILDAEEAPDPDARPGQKYAWVYAHIHKLKPGQFLFVPDSERAKAVQLLPSLRGKQTKLQVIARKWKDTSGRDGVGIWKTGRKQSPPQER